MKKIFILTGEPSGDKLASKVIAQLKNSRSDIEYLSVGGENLGALGIKSIYDLKEITYLGFTKVLMNLLKIKRKINKTVDEIIKFEPNILFSVDSPDFTLRVAKLVKNKNPNIKTIHYVAPQVWVWRENRVKKIKKFIDHLLLLFQFEYKYFAKENMKTSFVGHPFLDEEKKEKIDISQLLNNSKKTISIFPGSRISEINILLPILIKFINLMNANNNDFFYVFHTNKEHKKLVYETLKKANLINCETISEQSIKSVVLEKSILAIAKSGTVSLEICKAGVPTIIIYKMNFINFFILRLLVKVKYANIINIISNSEIIPELIQKKCNAKNIFEKTNMFLKNPNLMNAQVDEYKKILKGIRSDIPSVEKVSKILNESLN